MNKTTFHILGLIFIAEAMFSLHLSREIQGTRKSAAATQRKQLNTASRRITAPTPQANSQEPKYVETRHVREVSPPTDETRRIAEKMRAVKESSEAQLVRDAKQNLELLIRYGPLIKKLQLSPDAADRLLALLLDRSKAPKDVENIMANGNTPTLTNSDAFYRSAVAASSAEINSEIEALLGKDRYVTFVAFEAQMPINLEVVSIDQTLVGYGIGLDQQQINHLFELLRNESNENELGPIAFPVDSGESGQLHVDGHVFRLLGKNDVSIDNQSRTQVARGLTEEQLKSSETFLNRQQVEVLRHLAEVRIKEHELATRFNIK